MIRKEKLLEALKRVGEKLDAEGKVGEILLTGGATMSLVLDARTSTQDVDALYEPKDDINNIAKEVAIEMNLPQDWLNDSVKGFMSPGAEVHEYKTFAGLRITTVTPEYLLAMKLLSARISDTDLEDAGFLMKKLKIGTAEQAYEVLEKYYPVERVLPKTKYFIEEILEKIE